MNGTKGNTSVKRLSAQFIARFFKHFPEEAENAINALLDLCEDDDVDVSDFWLAVNIQFLCL